MPAVTDPAPLIDPAVPSASEVTAYPSHHPWEVKAFAFPSAVVASVAATAIAAAAAETSHAVVVGASSNNKYAYPLAEGLKLLPLQPSGLADSKIQIRLGYSVPPLSALD